MRQLFLGGLTRHMPFFLLEGKKLEINNWSPKWWSLDKNPWSMGFGASRLVNTLTCWIGAPQTNGVRNSSAWEHYGTHRIHLFIQLLSISFIIKQTSKHVSLNSCELFCSSKLSILRGLWKLIYRQLIRRSICDNLGFAIGFKSGDSLVRLSP